jgi:hypothetical protein
VVYEFVRDMLRKEEGRDWRNMVRESGNEVIRSEESM